MFIIAYMKRRRLSAEAVRDTMLKVSGLMNEKMYGAPTYPPQPNGVWQLRGRNNKPYSEPNERSFQKKCLHHLRRSAILMWSCTSTLMLQTVLHVWCKDPIQTHRYRH